MSYIRPGADKYPPENAIFNPFTVLIKETLIPELHGLPFFLWYSIYLWCREEVIRWKNTLSNIERLGRQLFGALVKWQ